MNDSPKHVVASRTPAVDWNNSNVVGPYDAAKLALTDCQAYNNGVVHLAYKPA